MDTRLWIRLGSWVQNMEHRCQLSLGDTPDVLEDCRCGAVVDPCLAWLPFPWRPPGGLPCRSIVSNSSIARYRSQCDALKNITHSLRRLHTRLTRSGRSAASLSISSLVPHHLRVHRTQPPLEKASLRTRPNSQSQFFNTPPPIAPECKT